MSLLADMTKAFFEYVLPRIPIRLSEFPWQTMEPPLKTASIQPQRALKVYLVGTRPRSARVSYLVITNLSGRNAVRFFDLVGGGMRLQKPVNGSWIDFIGSIGHELQIPVPQPGVDQVAAWVAYGRSQAAEMKRSQGAGMKMKIVPGLAMIPKLGQTENDPTPVEQLS